MEYIKKLMIAENVDATGVEKLINVNILEVKGKKHNNFNFSTFKKLEYLDINKVGIETLDVSALEHLKSIKANDNNLKEIKFNLTNKIEWLDLKGNNFTNGLSGTFCVFFSLPGTNASIILSSTITSAMLYFSSSFICFVSLIDASTRSLIIESTSLPT